MRYISKILLAAIFLVSCSKEGDSPITTNNTIITTGHYFSPLLLNCNIGDTIFFELGTTHNAIEVSEANYNACLLYTSDAADEP